MRAGGNRGGQRGQGLRGESSCAPRLDFTGPRRLVGEPARPQAQEGSGCMTFGLLAPAGF